MYVKQTNTADTISRAPVRLENGRMALRECRPKLHFKKPARFHNQTPVDIENRLLHTLRIIKIVRGE